MESRSKLQVSSSESSDLVPTILIASTVIAMAEGSSSRAKGRALASSNLSTLVNGLRRLTFFDAVAEGMLGLELPSLYTVSTSARDDHIVLTPHALKVWLTFFIYYKRRGYEYSLVAFRRYFILTNVGACDNAMYFVKAQSLDNYVFGYLLVDSDDDDDQSKVTFSPDQGVLMKESRKRKQQLNDDEDEVEDEDMGIEETGFSPMTGEPNLKIGGEAATTTWSGATTLSTPETRTNEEVVDLEGD
ncbi:hypothetical protein CRG98_026060 [Punica granatum]|uniref:Uncharacterized protein n=1 Tax=Punica granatum TaxID=22663 RepID=A0A2I0JB99_PUNGR|nr:hypothetical protein CRG98_026060 [Punica granatum]